MDALVGALGSAAAAGRNAAVRANAAASVNAAAEPESGGGGPQLESSIASVGRCRLIPG